MFKRLVETEVRKLFDSNSVEDIPDILSRMGENVVHTVNGNHALSGTRRGHSDIRLWYERLYRLFLEVNYTITSLEVSGTLVDVSVDVRWINTSKTVIEETYRVDGVTIISLSGATVCSTRTITDTTYVTRYLQKLGVTVPEALADPIVTGSARR